MELVRGSASIWIPILVGLATALVGGAFLTAGRMRRELATDVQLLQALPKSVPAEEHLNKSVQSRILRLVGLARHPAVAASDVVGILGIIVVEALGLAIVMTPASKALGQLLQIVIAGATALAVGLGLEIFYKGWSRRAVARFRFLAELLDQDEVDDLEELLGGANSLVRTFHFFPVFSPGIVLLLSAGPPGQGVAAALAFVLCFGVCVIVSFRFYRLVGKSQLTADLGSYSRARQARNAS